ncbi:hypothetical protein LguiB_021002 [Lonicera macranthoides]
MSALQSFVAPNVQADPISLKAYSLGLTDGPGLNDEEPIEDTLRCKQLSMLRQLVEADTHKGWCTCRDTLSESGWPSKGGTGASVDNARIVSVGSSFYINEKEMVCRRALPTCQRPCLDHHPPSPCFSTNFGALNAVSEHLVKVREVPRLLQSRWQSPMLSVSYAIRVSRRASELVSRAPELESHHPLCGIKS